MSNTWVKTSGNEVTFSHTSHELGAFEIGFEDVNGDGEIGEGDRISHWDGGHGQKPKNIEEGLRLLAKIVFPQEKPHVGIKGIKLFAKSAFDAARGNVKAVDAASALATSRAEQRNYPKSMKGTGNGADIMSRIRYNACEVKGEGAIKAGHKRAQAMDRTGVRRVKDEYQKECGNKEVITKLAEQEGIEEQYRIIDEQYRNLLREANRATFTSDALGIYRRIYKMIGRHPFRQRDFYDRCIKAGERYQQQGKPDYARNYFGMARDTARLIAKNHQGEGESLRTAAEQKISQCRPGG